MATSKKQLMYLYIGIFIVVVIISSLATVYVRKSSGSFSSEEKAGTDGRSSLAPFGKFDGHEACVKEIRHMTDGNIIGLLSDDRTAKYQRYNNTNQIVFQGQIQPPKSKFLSEQRSTYRASFKCSTSAKTNKVININIERADSQNLK